ncbi:hypothetical protein JYK21_07190 [Ralstonia pickettii]|nr:hypothetical protein [Ralstonia pickettii]
MRAYIKLWGKEYLLTTVSWFKETELIAYVAFSDENGKHCIVHHKFFDEIPDAEHNRNAEILNSNLQETVIWKEK